jgi:2-polyprenyl-3-methyl-5-hydroxy-6-metoxy-1,4-benzoquinol methylase
MESEYIEYKWENPKTTAHEYIVPVIIKILKELNLPSDAKILDAGCGGGYFLNELYKLGYKEIYGFDASFSGIKIAKRNFPHLSDRLHLHNVYEQNLPVDIPSEYDVVISMEVIEHLYSPEKYIQNIHRWLKENGILIITTPYHGYLKNLVIALLNKFDTHFNPLWEGGHIKFFSKKSLIELLMKNKFDILKFRGAGRLPFLWKSMIIVSRKKINLPVSNQTAIN